ncbi:sugar ABC transporter ATP-binding protein [Pseudomonas syringae pv. tagetis]|uniref:Putative Ribose ABC transporter, ATP-binding protein n=2 Tax=Pseudomonas syringae group genomosp. 7 TaxID=251699 RepID=A0A0Q0HIQ3_9PSED|nr:sugar ABC transporter ATP-binding protein [Pseudomonas syringae group genomosp. 7]KPX42553.1 putative Ribose ABC transporter, ATP-binding protein [Pseudomonas syringae pv. helianthi]KPY89035.1 putative Ribose ABC transporter, ATP-binding protein [Pseudomonas syringae pv. tagetis]RMR01976.1 putative Ribose ABC transporter, ATP-binding protein [Pseudomonas syringae pv. helianthi]RMW16523.1 putative Ribose ABC transporter, ATP-binding protein [Pseudomonas syringae pv. tagetis]RMW18801.1 hypoth
MGSAIAESAVPPALHLTSISKRFGATQALDRVNLRVEAGTIHGLVGENGAGKSTLIKVLAGIHHADAGCLSIHGQQFDSFSPRQIEAAGVHFIHQERLLPGSFTVGEALFFGQEIKRGLFVDRRAQEREAARLLDDYFAMRLPIGALVRDLDSAQRQILQITRALLAKPRVLVFDEPSVSLVKQEVDRLLAIVRRLRDEGLTIVYISHYLQEIQALCDQVTVLRNGRDVAVVDPALASPAQIARLMVNRDVGEQYVRAQTLPGQPVLQLSGLGAGRFYEGVDLSVRRGEVVGLTGLVGSGAKELLKSLFGLLRPDRGDCLLNGQPLHLNSPRDAVRNGIALVPEERRTHGVAPALSVLENMTLASLGRFSRWGWLDAAAQARESGRLIDELAIKALGHDAAVQLLSGGNQQKVALAKWLSRHSTLYLLDEPSVGVDIGAKVEIYRLIARLAEGGAAVLVLSSDLPELIGITQRIVVLHRGRIAGEFDSRSTDSDQLLACATGAGENPHNSTKNLQEPQHVSA